MIRILHQWFYNWLQTILDKQYSTNVSLIAVTELSSNQCKAFTVVATACLLSCQCQESELNSLYEMLYTFLFTAYSTLSNTMG